MGPDAAPPTTKTVRVVPNFVTVIDQVMRTPKPEDWLIHRGTYQAWGYSSLDRINKANVKIYSWSGRAPWSPAAMRQRPSSTTAWCT
jgi:hypothetical protein